MFLSGYNVSFETNVVSNTIDQPLGDAIRVEFNHTNVHLRNNILAVQSGRAISVDNTSQQSFTSDFNMFHMPAAAR